MTERTEQVTQISADNLKKGGFLFQMPEDASENDIKEFETTLKTAQEKGLNLTVSNKIKIIDTSNKDVKVTNQPETVEQPKEVVKAEPTPEVSQPVTQAPKVEEKPKQANPEIQAVMPNGFMYPGMTPMGYQPQWIGYQPVQQGVPQYVPQYLPWGMSPQPSTTGATPYNVVFPYSGIVPPKNNQPQEDKQ